MEAVSRSFVLERCFRKGCGRDARDNDHTDNIGLAGGALKLREGHRKRIEQIYEETYG
jgi:hypothetical protein